MKVLGIIAEYNPFHKGHAYQLKQAREQTKCDYCVIVMSGDFTQRGIPAIMPKRERARQALLNGADLVIELPSIYAVSSAESFAYGAVSLLNALGVVTDLSFGVETNAPALFSHLGKLLCDEPDHYGDLLKACISKGISYPVARQTALLSVLEEELRVEGKALLSSPNNILGLEYHKALYQLNSAIKPLLITRNGAGYHETQISETKFASASGIRSSLLNDHPLSFIKQQIPENGHSELQNTYGKTWPIFPDDLSAILHYQLLFSSENELSEILDSSPAIAARIIKLLEQYQSFEQFNALLKTKELTYTRITRILTHVILHMTKKDCLPILTKQAPYARILGFRKTALPLLHEIKTQSRIPLLSKLADAQELLSADAMDSLMLDVRSSHLYHSIVEQKYGTHLPNEYRTPILVL